LLPSRTTEISRRRLLGLALMILMTLPSWGQQDARPLTVSGWMDGYFISPGGDLAFRTLGLSSTPSADPGLALHPLWAGYRVRLSFAPNDDVTAIVVTALESGEVLTEKRFARRRSWRGLLLVNDDDGGFCHSSDGLSYRLTVTYADGGRADAVVSLDDVRLLPALQPRIDWIDLVRISEVRRWLRVAGDDLLPGLRADDVPFALMTSDDQVLLVDWPETPEGFEAYTGPAPTSSPLLIGQPAEDQMPSVTGAAGYAGVFRGTLAVLMPFTDEWWRFTDRSSDQRPAALLHEVCHVNWQRARSGGALGALAIPPLEARVLEEIARELLAQDGARADGFPRVYQYIALMEERDRLLADRPGTRDGWRRLETDEAYAYYVSWLSGSVLRPLMVESPLNALLCKPGHGGGGTMERGILRAFQDMTAEYSSALYWWPGAHAPYHGFREATMLYRTDPDGVRSAWRDRSSIRDALAGCSGYDVLDSERQGVVLRSTLRAAEYDRRLEAYRGTAAEGTSLIVERFRDPDGPGRTPVVFIAHFHPAEGPPLGLPEPQFLEMFAVGVENMFEVVSQGPSLVSFVLERRGASVQLRTLMEEVTALSDHPDGAPLLLNEEEVKLYAPNARVTDNGGVLTVHMGQSSGS
jgi:hypothetical protein